MKTPTLFMETTEIAADKTAAEITGALVRAGATHIQMEYGPAGNIAALRFGMRVKFAQGEAVLPFAVPVRVEPVYCILANRTSAAKKGWILGDTKKAKIMAQAERVAWRQLLRWVQAQLAMIDTGMVQTAEVFMPYQVNDKGQTLFQWYQESGLKMLSAGGK